MIVSVQLSLFNGTTLCGHCSSQSPEHDYHQTMILLFNCIPSVAGIRLPALQVSHSRDTTFNHTALQGWCIEASQAGLLRTKPWAQDSCL